jgi:hypothetical protein
MSSNGISGRNITKGRWSVRPLPMAKIRQKTENARSEEALLLQILAVIKNMK